MSVSGRGVFTKQEMKRAERDLRKTEERIRLEISYSQKLKKRVDRLQNKKQNINTEVR